MKPSSKAARILPFSALLLGFLTYVGAASYASAQTITVTSANPGSAPPGTVSLNVTVNGNGFKKGAVAKWFVTGTTNPGGVTVNSTAFVSSSQLTANITVAQDATISKFDIVVTNADGRTGKGTELFAVAPADPEIAFTQAQGTTQSIYVANADGTDPVGVYSLKGGGIGEVAFVPGSGSRSGQLVFIQFNTVKLLTFTVTANSVWTNSVVTLASEPTNIHYLNVSPVTSAGQFVLYGAGHPDNSTTIKVISIAGGTATSVATGYLGDAAWSRDLTRIAVLIGNPHAVGVQQIEMLNLDSNFVAGSSTVIYGPTSCNGCLNNIQFARTSDEVIFDTGGLGVMYAIDADVTYPSVATPFAVSGYQPCLNHDDTEIIFRRVSDSAVFVYDIATNVQTAVTAGPAASPEFRAWTP